MAGEYYRWLARNEKPEEKRELTPKEKRKNWWHYNKWYVLLGILAAAGLIRAVIGFVQSKNDQPDYSVAYVGSYALPDSTVEQLETALARFGEDRNENGKVTVEIHQYLINADEDENAQVTGTDASYVYAGMVQLEADLVSGDSFLFLMEDPQRFQEEYQILSRIDGSLPEEDANSDVPFYVSWNDCPVLTGLSLGVYSVELPEETMEISNQDLLSGLYLARRGFWVEQDADELEANTAFWNRLLEGAFE